MTAGLRVEGLTVRFGATVAVDDVTLAVSPGEVVALVGPSGCGKSTLLRAVAGLEHPEAGSVHWGDEDLTHRPPDRRRLGLMFQDHALFAHRTVAENVGFGLRMAGQGRAERTGRVDELLELVGLAGTGDRPVDSLSGGEAQRVALARALAPAPRLLMLDEPLGSLDRRLRDRLAEDLRDILREQDLAAVHVTHDQEEAYAVADRLAVMERGALRCDGPAPAVWRDPGTPFVARFLGHDNVLDVDTAAALGLPHGRGGAVVREAAIGLVPAGETTGGRGAPASATVEAVRFRGGTSEVTVRLHDGPGSVRLHRHEDHPPHEGESVGITLDPGEVSPLDPDPRTDG